MKSGIIGLVHSDSRAIQDSIESRDEDGTSLKRCIEVSDSIQLDSGIEAQVGSIAKEKLVREDTPVIQDGAIRMESTREVETDFVQFAAVPGDLVIRGTGGGDYAFDIVGRQIETLVERGEINLDAFVSDHEDASYWQYGFSDTGLNAENGVFYGIEIEKDDHVQTFMSSSTTNQIGFDMLYGDKPVKARMSQSGYLEVYQPEEWETREFIQFTLDEVLPYVRSP